MSKLSHVSLLGFSVGLLLSVSATAHATVMFTPPPDLLPGDTYRLVFLSSLREPLLNDFSRYDYVVTQAANNSSIGLPATTWRALGAFYGRTVAEQIAAGGNADDPVYRVDGVIVTSNVSTLDVTTLVSQRDSLTNLINVDENGNPNISSEVWTSTIGSAPTARRGLSYDFSNWFSASSASIITEYPFYAISNTIIVSSATVPDDIPEPMSVVMLGSGVLLVGLMSRLRHRRRSGETMAGVA